MPDEPITVLIPAYNEEQSVADTVRAAWQIPGVIQVIVVDDGSRDKTAELALKNGAEVISLAVNSGKGGALNAGARHIKGELVLMLDADLGGSAANAAVLIGPVASGEADMTVAVPPGAEKRGFGLVRELAGAGIKYFTGLSMKAPLSGQRAMARRFLVDCLPLADGYGVEVDLTVRAGKKGYSILEMPVNIRHRETGRDIRGFLHRGKQFCHLIKTLLTIGKSG